MTETEIKALIVGPEDTLFVVFNGDDVSNDQIRAIGKSIFETRPELKGRVFIMGGEDIELAVVKKSEVKDGESDS